MGQTAFSNVRDRLPALMPRLWRYALVLTCNRTDADDLAQATASRALERADQFIEGTRLDSWCFAILSSIWKNELRSRAVRRGQGFVPVDEAELLAPGDTEVNILARQVLHQILQLPEAHRETVHLVYVEGFTYAEAAERLDVPIGTVMSRLPNARRKLAQEPKRKVAAQ